MGLLKKDALKTLERDLARAREKHAQLVERLHNAEAVLVEKQNACSRAAAADAVDDPSLDQAEAAVANAQRRVATLSGGIGVLDNEISELEVRLRNEQAARERERVASEIETIGKSFGDAHADFKPAIARLREAAEPAAAMVPECVGLFHFLKAATDEIDTAIAIVLRELRTRADHVRVGHAPAVLPRPAKPEPEPPKLDMGPRMHLTFEHAARWREGDEEIRVGRYSEAQVPVSIAERALKRKIAFAWDSVQAKALRSIHGTQWAAPLPSDCVDLDQDEPLAVEVTPLQEHRGEPYVAISN